MSQAVIVIELLKGLKDLVGHFETIDEYSKAAERAKEGKDPFPPPKQVQEMLDNNARIAKWLERIRRKGVMEPELPKVSMDQLADLGTRASAMAGLREGMRMRDEHGQRVRELVDRLKLLTREARAKADAARIVSDFFGDLVDAPLPDIGTLNKTTYFTNHQIFRRLAGSISTIESRSIRAIKVLEAHLKEFERQSANMRGNLELLGIEPRRPGRSPQVAP